MIAILADTHIPKGARRLPDRCVDLVANAEAVVHAGGDWRACAAALRTRTRWSSVTVTSPSTKRKTAFQIFNPGSPTERRRAPQPSMGLVEVGEAGLAFEHVWL